MVKNQVTSMRIFANWKVLPLNFFFLPTPN